MGLAKVSNIKYDHQVPPRFAESHFVKCRVNFSFHHFQFLSLMRYNFFMGVNKMLVKKYYRYCVG